MLIREENELVTRVGAGTPAGELLRRYWHPVAVASELTPTQSKKRIEIMGEALVLFRDGEGRYGMVEEHCAHRGASLYYGFIEQDGIRCPYHGWKYDVGGKCLEQPFEPKDNRFRDKICQKAYPVEKLAGLLFVYMGPKPAPLLPRWDLLVREDGQRRIVVLPVHGCNWLQAMENSVDPVHTYYLHAHQFKLQGHDLGGYYYRPIRGLEFEEIRGPVWAGVVKKRTYEDDEIEREVGHPLIFPNMLYAPQGPDLVMHWRVPMDDTHTYIVWMCFKPSEKGERLEQPEDPPVDYLPSMMTPEGEYVMSSFPNQDRMAWETQGQIFDRSKENLGTSDKGVILYRKMLREQIEVVRNGGEPLGLIRDPEKNRIVEFAVSSGQARPEYLQARTAYYRGQSSA